MDWFTWSFVAKLLALWIGGIAGIATVAWSFAKFDGEEEDNAEG